VGRQPVPHQRRLLPAEETSQLSEGPDQAVGVVGADLMVEGQGRATAGAITQPRGHRRTLPLEAVVNDRGMPAWRPGPAGHGSSETPDSSQNTMTALRLRAFPEPAASRAPPTLDNLFIALDRAAAPAHDDPTSFGTA
jgi:hypothetical protein